MDSNTLAKLLTDYGRNKNEFISEVQKIDRNADRNSLSKLWDIAYGGKSSASTANLTTDNPEIKKLNYVDFTKKFFEASATGRMPYVADINAVNDTMDLLINKEGKFVTLQELGSKVMEKLLEQSLIYTQQQTALLNIINEGTSLTGQYSEDFRNTLTDANPRLEQLGISFDELASAGTKLVTDSGKFAIVNQQTWERAGAVSKAYVGTLADLVNMYPAFAQVGLGAADAGERIADAGQKSIELGLESKKITKDVAANLGKLNEFGFKNGVDGLTRMVQRATELRMNLENVFTLANKVMEPEGALDLSANLQALGGAIGDLNDPMKLMYMATNNVEGFTEAISGAAASLTTYNEAQGRFEVTGVNLRRAKAMADQLGMSMGELNKIAIATAERTRVSTELMARGLTIKDDQKEFISNIAQMKGGKMVIELGSSTELRKVFQKSEVAIDELTQDQLDTLMKYQNEFKKATPEDIIRNQATAVQNINRDTAFMVAMLRKTGGKSAEKVFEEISETFGYSAKDLTNSTLKISKDIGKFIEGGEFKVEEYMKKLKEDILSNTKKTTTVNQPNTVPTQTTTNVNTAVQPVVSTKPDVRNTEPPIVRNAPPISLNNIPTTKANEYINLNPNYDGFLSKFEQILQSTKIDTANKNTNMTINFKADNNIMDPIMRNFTNSTEFVKNFLSERDYLKV